VQFLESRLIALARAAKAGPVLTCKGKGVQATGYVASQGFVVRAGSQAVVGSAPPAPQQQWCWAAAPMGGWNGRRRRLLSSLICSRFDSL